MPDEQKPETPAVVPKAPEPAPPVEAPKEEETQYHLSTLLEGAERLFGFPHWVVEGALHHAKITGKETYTKPEVQTAVDNFVKQEDKGHAAAIKEGT